MAFVTADPFHLEADPPYYSADDFAQDYDYRRVLAVGGGSEHWAWDLSITNDSPFSVGEDAFHPDTICAANAEASFHSTPLPHSLPGLMLIDDGQPAMHSLSPLVLDSDDTTDLAPAAGNDEDVQSLHPEDQTHSLSNHEVDDFAAMDCESDFHGDDAEAVGSDATHNVAHMIDIEGVEMPAESAPDNYRIPRRQHAYRNAPRSSRKAVNYRDAEEDEDEEHSPLPSRSHRKGSKPSASRVAPYIGGPRRRAADNNGLAGPRNKIYPRKDVEELLQKLERIPAKSGQRLACLCDDHPDFVARSDARAADFKRHILTHLNISLRCVGVPFDLIEVYGVAGDAGQFKVGGVPYVGGCGMLFTGKRKDALKRHCDTKGCPYYAKIRPRGL